MPDTPRSVVVREVRTSSIELSWPEIKGKKRYLVASVDVLRLFELILPIL